MLNITSLMGIKEDKGLTWEQMAYAVCEITHEVGVIHGDFQKVFESFRKMIMRVQVKKGQWLLENKRLSEGLVDHANYELQQAGLFDKDSDYNGMLGNAVMSLVEVFADQGHSGFSAAMCIDLFKRLASWKALTELTNNPQEWQLVSDYYSGPEEDLKGMEWQSRRIPSCFSSDGGKTYYDIDEECDDPSNKTIHTSKDWAELCQRDDS
jgi:hypothetical protein